MENKDEAQESLDAIASGVQRLAGAGMAFERVLYALMTAHPNPVGLNQCLLAELHPSKIPNIEMKPLLDAWEETSKRLLTHSATLAALAQSAGIAAKN